MTAAQLADPSGHRGIGALIEHLRRHGFAASTSEAIDATRLLVILARQEPQMDVARLRARLRPIFCRTREQQQRFDAVFDEWYRLGEPAVDQKPEAAGPPPAKKRDWTPWLAVAIAVVITALTIWQSADRPVVAPRVTTPPATTAVAPLPGTTATTTTTASTPSSAPGTTIAPPLTDRALRRKPVLGYFPRLRYNEELRPVWGWVLAVLPLIALAGFSIPALVISRTRARRRSEPMYLQRRSLEEEARRIVPPLRPDIALKLARHLRGSPEGEFRLTRRPILDIRATIEKTLRNRGIPSPVYRHTHMPPSYLLLVDVANQRDPRGRLFYQWAERLQRERLEVEIALVRLAENGQPQFRATSRGGLPRDERGWISLARLPEPPFGQRLLFISDGEPLVDKEGKWRAEATAARLYRWRQRAIFTPVEPRDWGKVEETIERMENTADPGFLVLPLDENALSAWTALLTTGQLSDVVLSEPQRFPGTLRRGKAHRYRGNEDIPDPEALEKLISQLRLYLGEIGFTWLAALAIPPLVRWELTVLLGRDVIQRLRPMRREDVDSLLSRNYRRLVRLPWLQNEWIPNWLRLRLLAELPETVQNELRDVVGKLLSKLSPTPPDDESIALEFDRPPRPHERGPTRPAREDSDPLYLGYMSGLTPNQLVMRAPAEWGQWLGKMRMPRREGLRGFLAWTGDYARSRWARLVFRGGSPFRGLRRGPVIASLFLLLSAAAFLTLAADADRGWWREPDWLFDERAHAIAFHHAGAIRAASFSADGLRVVTASDDGTARVWDVKTGKPATPPLRHGGPVTAAKFSRMENVVVSASGNTVRLWDGRTGMAIRAWNLDRPVRQIELDRDGSRILAVTGTEAAVIDVRTQRVTPLARGTGIHRAAFSADGRWIVTANHDEKARVWDSAGKLRRELRHGGDVSDAAFGRDDLVVLTCGRDGSVQLWETATGRPSKGTSWTTRGVGVAAFNRSIANRNVSSTARGIVQVAFNRSGSAVAGAGADGAARVWTWALAEPRLLILEHTGPVVSASFSSDEQRVLTASLDGTARVWNAATGKAIGSPLTHQRGLTSASFSPDGMRIVTAGLDGTARIWEALAEPEVQPLRHTDLLTAVSFDATGRRALTSSWDHAAKIWDASTGTQLVPPLRHDLAIWWAELSPDGRRVVTAGADGVAAIWDGTSGKRMALLAHGAPVLDAAFSPDGRRVVTGDRAGTAKIWDAATGRQVGRPLRHPDTVLSSRFSPDGKRVVTASEHTARVWDAGTGEMFGNPLRHYDVVRRAVFSPDGRSIATVSDDGSAQIWDANRTVAVTSPLMHYGPVYDVRFDAESRRIVTASHDGTARVWNAATGALLHVLEHGDSVHDVAFSPDGSVIESRDSVNHAAFSPDGKRIVTASDDGTARIWDAASGKLMAPPMRHRQWVSRAVFSPDGKLVITGDGLVPAAEGSAALAHEYVVPENSAQIWRVPPYVTPESSPSLAVRRRADAALQNVLRDLMKIILAIAATAVIVAVELGTWWRTTQIARLTQGKAE